MFLSIVLLISVVIVRLWAWWLKVVRSGSGPMMKGSLPLVGHTHRVFGDAEKLYRLTEEISYDSLANGGVSRFIFMFKTYYVVSDPEDIMTVGNNVLKKNFSSDFAKAWLGDGLLTASTSVWKHHRKLLTPAFSLQVLHGFLQVFNEQSRELVDKMAKEVDKGPVDISYYIKDNNLNTLTRTSLGLTKQNNTDLMSTYMKVTDEISNLISKRFINVWLHSDFAYSLTGLKKKENNSIKVLNELSDVVIKAKKLQSDENLNDSTNNAFLDRLLKLSASGALSETNVKEEVATMLLAGADTTSWVLTYTCIALGTYPEIQKKVSEELTEIFGNNNGDVSKEDLKRLVYLEAVIKETLRLYSIVPVGIRTLESGLQLKNYYLRPGNDVIMSYYGVNRHPAVWGPDAHQFRPERWLEESSSRSRLAFAGFGVGKRNCIGQTFSIISMKVLLSHLLRRYHFSGDITKLKLKLVTVGKPVSGHHVTLTERTHKPTSRVC